MRERHLRARSGAEAAIPVPGRCCTRSLVVLLAAAQFCAGMPAYGQQEPQQELRARFFHEAPEAWRRYQSFARNLVGTVSVTQAGKETKHELMQNEHCALYKTVFWSFPNKSYETRLFVQNSDYCFELRKQTESGPDWVINSISRDPEHVVNGAKSVRDEILWFTAQPTYVFDTALLTLVEDPRISFTSFKAVHSGGHELVEITFEFPEPILQSEVASYKPGMLGGSMLLDPQNGWTMIEYSVRVHSLDPKTLGKSGHVQIMRTTCFAKLLYDADSSPMHVVRRLESHAQFSNGVTISKSKEQIVFNLYVPSPVPADDEFKLSKFGFNEPEFVRGGLPLYVWVCALAAICLAGGLSLRWLAKKRNRRPGD
jgi:hypothetical protein